MPRKLSFLRSQGDPASGAIIRAGAVVEVPDFWADRFVADGTAVEVVEQIKPDEPQPEEPTTPAPKTKKGKSKK